MLRYDGIYLSPYGDSFYYLRFYEGGTVLAVYSRGNPSQVIEWFNKTNDAISKGIYQLKSREIEFYATSKRGTIDYSGMIKGETLELHSYSHINDHKGFRKYSFVKVSPCQKTAEDKKGNTHRQEPAQPIADMEEIYKGILGLKGEIAASGIKEAYRSAIAKYHPDKVQYLGKEFRILAEQKATEINKAYQYFRDKYSF